MLTTHIALVLALLTLVLVGGAAAEETLPVPTPARLALVEGDVLVQAQEGAGWAEATANLPVGAGDWIWVPGSGRAEIQFPTGQAIRLGDATRLGIRSVQTVGDPSAEVGLDRGTAWITTLHSRGPLRVSLSDTVVEVAAPAVARLAVSGDGGVQVAVHRAGVRVETSAGVFQPLSGQTLRLARDQAPAFSALAAPDAFDRWNNARDRQVAREPSPASLPAPLASQAADFAAHGRWVSAPAYGQVWAPSVGINWTPFRFGRWAWWRGECVWVADEPWGWTPYHYGRWIFDSAFGWAWVPPARGVVLWNPGAVVWIDEGDFIAWVPLAPGEVLTGPTVVNVVNVDVIQVNITKVFVNARIRNAAVAAAKRAFVAGARAHRAVATAPSHDVLAAGGRVLAAPPASLHPATLTVARRAVPVARATALSANPPDLPRSSARPPVGTQSVGESVGGPAPLPGSRAPVMPSVAGSLGHVTGVRSAPAVSGAVAATPGSPPSSGLRGGTTPVVGSPQPGAGRPGLVRSAGTAEQSVGTASQAGMGSPLGAAGGLPRPR